MRIIPAIDIIDGKCVRLVQGDYSQKKIYNEDPLEVAREFESYGMRYLHLVDLDGAKAKQIVNHKVLYNLAVKTNLQIDFGGGLRTQNDVYIAFENGAKQITGGSIAVENPEEFLSWICHYGGDKIILGADCKDRKIAVSAWQENSDQDVIRFIEEYRQKGISRVICTDVAKDGMLQGASDELYEEIIRSTGVNLIASGGIASIDDLYRLETLGCEGAIIGKAIYENKLSLKELSALC